MFISNNFDQNIDCLGYFELFISLKNRLGSCSERLILDLVLTQRPPPPPPQRYRSLWGSTKVRFRGNEWTCMLTTTLFSLLILTRRLSPAAGKQNVCWSGEPGPYRARSRHQTVPTKLFWRNFWISKLLSSLISRMCGLAHTDL